MKVRMVEQSQCELHFVPVFYWEGYGDCFILKKTRILEGLLLSGASGTNSFWKGPASRLRASSSSK